ncbi:MAG: XrtA system polysaccharide deacetylase [Fimbriiglobus sp.]
MPDTRIVLSFDVEEHHRIEAAAKVSCSAELKAEYARRMESTTREILDKLAKHNTPATFYIVGEIAETHPDLVRDIAQAGHEIGTHSYDHRRVHAFTAETFREDLKRSIDVLEQVSGQKVWGYRAPTFSVMKQTSWAIDVLADLGLKYDTSIFPVHHDRYGVPEAPRTPFVVQGFHREILELPMTTYRLGGQNLPVAGGGYFRLFPLYLMKRGIRQMSKQDAPLAMLYFHPWEFDPTQPKLPLKRLSQWRTYVGIKKSFPRLEQLLTKYAGRFTTAKAVVESLDSTRLPRFALANPSAAV